jgi:hypothetical protein
MTILNNLYTIKSGIKSNNPVTLFEIFKNDNNITDNTKPKLEKRRSLNQYIKETMKNNNNINPTTSINANKNAAINEDTVSSNKFLQVNLPKNVARFPNLESIIVGNYDDNFYTIQSIGEDSTTQTTNVNLSTMFNAATNLKTSTEISGSSPNSINNRRASFDPKALKLDEKDFDDNEEEDDDDDDESLSESDDDDDSDSDDDSAVREKIKQLNQKQKCNSKLANLPKSFEVNAKSNEEYYLQNNNLTKTTSNSVAMSDINEEGEEEAMGSEDMGFSVDMFEKIMVDYKNICRNEIEHLANRYKKVQKVKEKYEEAAIFQELFDRDILKNK